jgi:hypothetical protein
VFAVGSLDCELLREPIALLGSVAAHPKRRPSASGPHDADEDEAGTHKEYDERTDASNDKPSGGDDECSAEHVDVHAGRVLHEHVNRESGRCGNEQ